MSEGSSLKREGEFLVIRIHWKEAFLFLMVLNPIRAGEVSSKKTNDFRMRLKQGATRVASKAGWI